MIPRYSTKDMSLIWSTKNKYKLWLKIEILACEIQEKLGVIPKNKSAVIKKLANFDEEKILLIEKETKHDVIAFLTNLAEYVGDNSKFIHKGLTSSDILDTCFSIQLSEATDLLIKELKEVLLVLKKKAAKYKYLQCIGRSHGIHAEPMTMGLKFAYAYAEFDRNLYRLKNAKKEISVCKISGPVGTYSSVSPKVEEYVAKKLKLKPETVSTQIIPRDRHANFFSTLSILASSIERLSVEIRHMQRTEVLEAEEYFSVGQKGSSAMPHKRNPVLSENLTGLARYIRNTCNSSTENIVLWHERDISHSSVERIIGPDITIAMHFSLIRLKDLIKNLVIYPKNIQRNLDQLQGLHFSQNVMLKLIDKGVTREVAYKIVQESAMKTWNSIRTNKNKSFLSFLLSNKKVSSKINKKELIKIFNNKLFIKNINHIYKNVFK
ncbi:MAG: Adenylosuccinate lyase [Alphaproteobacteria bacterium MarineAlpha9_Bin4]|nr:adenylosuccinate lyase [Pelagibacterales bacterium]PPR26999.1 MAG: Adenylosuccinate lyase [Alphaproteobacteria bacterium MarineAlpha9_Bin4]|tara:strand:+ start:362 stop:1669 length:1308 start_codon:yes stop_codon:yes gene_type:complete